MWEWINGSVVRPLINGIFLAISDVLWQICRFLLQIINSIDTGFQFLLYQPYSNIIFGTSTSGNLIFFPDTSSPIFYVWIAMFAAGALLTVIFFAVKAIRNIRNQGTIAQADRTSVAFGKIFIVIISIILLPFAFITGMNLISDSTNLIFDNSQQVDESDIQLLDSEINSQLILGAEALNGIVGNKLWEATDSISGIYSHTNGSYTDPFDINAQSLTPFSNWDDYFSKLNSELSFLNSFASSANNNAFISLSESLQEEVEAYNTEYFLNLEDETLENDENILASLRVLSSYIDQAVIGAELLSSRAYSIAYDSITNAMDNVNNFLLDTEEVFSFIGSVKLNASILTTSLNLIPEISDSFDVNTPNNLTWDILDQQSGLSSDEITNNQIGISLYNIIQLSDTFLLDSTNSSRYVYQYPDVDNVAWISEYSTIWDFALQVDSAVIGRILGGKSISLSTIYEPYSIGSSNNPLILSIYQLISTRQDSNWNTNQRFNIPFEQAISRITIGIVIAIIAIVVLARLVIAVVVRIIKLIWLWIIGLFVLPSSINNQRPSQVWVSIIFVEMLSLFAILLMYQLWQLLSSEFLVLISNSRLDSTTQGIVSTMIFLGMIVAVERSSGYLAKILGTSNSFRDSIYLIRQQKLTRTSNSSGGNNNSQYSVGKRYRSVNEGIKSQNSSSSSLGSSSVKRASPNAGRGFAKGLDSGSSFDRPKAPTRSPTSKASSAPTSNKRERGMAQRQKPSARQRKPETGKSKTKKQE